MNWEADTAACLSLFCYGAGAQRKFYDVLFVSSQKSRKKS